jgi:mono/diheme cytochrome c family protein
MSMARKLTVAVSIGCLSIFIARIAHAEQAKPSGFPEAPGQQVVLNKCFQCHSPAMWMDLRQDRRGWESTLYRMVGRGALWTEDEIRSMADYLAAVYGTESHKAAK